jgi:hypothetical protein
MHPQVTKPVQPEFIHKCPNQSNQNASTSDQTSPTRIHPQVTKPVQPEFIHPKGRKVPRYLPSPACLPACESNQLLGLIAVLHNTTRKFALDQKSGLFFVCCFLCFFSLSVSLSRSNSFLA